jgi:hypothetical protein
MGVGERRVIQADSAIYSTGMDRVRLTSSRVLNAAGLCTRRLVLRHAHDGKRTYAAERWGVRELLHDFFSAPLIFPWRSHLLPHTPSARKLYARMLPCSFRATLPCGVLDRQQWFHLVFDQLVRFAALARVSVISVLV